LCITFVISKHKFVKLKLTLTLVLTLTDTGGAVLTLMLGYRSVGLSNPRTIDTLYLPMQHFTLLFYGKELYQLLIRKELKISPEIQNLLLGNIRRLRSTGLYNIYKSRNRQRKT